MTEVHSLSRLRGRVGVGVLPHAVAEVIDFPHPPRFARRPPPQAGEVKNHRCALATHAKIIA
jgi:hypothetical protein